MRPKALLVMVLMVASMVLMASAGELADVNETLVIDLNDLKWYKHYHYLIHLSKSASSLVRLLDIMPHGVGNRSASTFEQLDAHTLETVALFATVRESDLYFPPCGNYSMQVEEQRAVVKQHAKNLTNEAVEGKRGVLKAALAQQVGHYVRSLAYGMFSQVIAHITSFQEDWKDYVTRVGRNPLLLSGQLEPRVEVLMSDALEAIIKQLGRDEQDGYEGALQQLVTLRTHAFAHMLTGVANVVWKDLETYKALQAQEERAIYAGPNNTAQLFIHAHTILHQIEQVTGPSATSYASFLQLQSRADAISLQLLQHLTTTTKEGIPEVPEESNSTPQTKSSSETDPIPPPTHSRKARSVEGHRMKPKVIMRLHDLP